MTDASIALTEAFAEQLKNFWKELAWQLVRKPHRDGMTDIFDQYQHLTKLIDADAAENEEHAEMLARALAIRDGS
jgi:hypothetical protein